MLLLEKLTLLFNVDDDDDDNDNDDEDVAFFNSSKLSVDEALIGECGGNDG